MLHPVTVITAAEVVDMCVPTSIELDGSAGELLWDSQLRWLASHRFPDGSVWAEGTS